MPAPTIPSRGGPTGGRGKGRGIGGKTVFGAGTAQAKRHRKIVRDSIRGITKPDIRRLARRGGVKRISGAIYDDCRLALKQKLQVYLKDLVAIAEYRSRKTITAFDVIFVLRKHGRPIYGFDPDTYYPTVRRNAVENVERA